jgi:uncharacterized protein YraI
VKTVTTVSVAVALALMFVAVAAPPTLALHSMAAAAVGVDMPENYLRIRSGPGSWYSVIGGIPMGGPLQLTGLRNGIWVQISQPLLGWVYEAQIGPVLTGSVTPVVTVPAYVAPYETVSSYRYGPSWQRHGHYYSNPVGAGVVVGRRGVGVHVGGVGVAVGRHGGARVRVR